MASVARWCCCGACTPSVTLCTHCTDVTPTQYTVTFSGVSFCTGCYSADGAGTGTYFKVDATAMDAEINKSHTLTQSSSCFWTVSAGSGMEFDEYSDAGCTTLLGAGSVSLAYGLRKTASDEWRLTIESNLGSPFGDFLYDDTFTGSGAGICATLPDSANENTAGGCSQSRYAYGGTATVVCE